MQLTERASKESARDYAVRMIRDNIISLKLEPGCIVSEKELSEILGLSRTPVREALIELSKSGIVVIYPQHGSMVSKIDYDEIEEAGFMREVMETAVVAIVCHAAGQDDIHYLQDNLMLQKASLDRDDGAGLLRHDNAFHRRLFEIAKKNRCYDMINSMAIHFDRVRQMSLVVEKNFKVLDDHQAILDAIIARDADRAKACMHTHLTRYRVDKRAIQEKFRGYFAE